MKNARDGRWAELPEQALALALMLLGAFSVPLAGSLRQSHLHLAISAAVLFTGLAISSLLLIVGRDSADSPR